MRLVIFGADGFIGAAVSTAMKNIGATVFNGFDEAGNRVDLRSVNDIKNYLITLNPDYVINCAGVIGEGMNFDYNRIFSKNIIEGCAEAAPNVKRIIITGSASEYGIVKKLPVSEDDELLGETPYAKSKIKEEQTALKLAEKYNLSVVVIRIFNPIGKGMNNKLLLPNLLSQVSGLDQSVSPEIQINNLEDKRDYVAVSDVASAYASIITGKPTHKVYNVGSGVATSNKELLGMVKKAYDIKVKFKIIQTQAGQPLEVASQADISRICTDLGWQPENTLEEEIRKIAKNE